MSFDAKEFLMNMAGVDDYQMDVEAESQHEVTVVKEQPESKNLLGQPVKTDPSKNKYVREVIFDNRKPGLAKYEMEFRFDCTGTINGKRMDFEFRCIVEQFSDALKMLNDFFYKEKIINPTSDNYEFVSATKLVATSEPSE